MDIDVKDITLDNYQEVVPFAEQLEAGSKKLVGSNAKKVQNESAYLNTKTLLTDRHRMLVFNIDLAYDKLETAKIISEADQKTFEKFLYERPVYRLYYAGLVGKEIAGSFFTGKDLDLHSRKIDFAHTEEGLANLKLVVDQDYNIDLIAFFRSSSNKILAADFIGLYFILYEFMEDVRYKDIKWGNKNITMMITDYHHI